MLSFPIPYSLLFLSLDLATSFICFGSCDELASSFPEPVLLASEVAVSCTSNSLPMSALGWLVLSVVELILFVMIMRKTRRDKQRGLVSRSTSNGDIVTVIANDSTSYFVMYGIYFLVIVQRLTFRGRIFTASVIGTCLSFVAEVQSSNSVRVIATLNDHPRFNIID